MTCTDLRDSHRVKGGEIAAWGLLIGEEFGDITVQWEDGVYQDEGDTGKVVKRSIRNRLVIRSIRLGAGIRQIYSDDHVENIDICADIPFDPQTTALIIGKQKASYEAWANDVKELEQSLCGVFGLKDIILRKDQWNGPEPKYDDNPHGRTCFAEPGSRRQIIVNALLPGEDEWSEVPDGTGKEIEESLSQGYALVKKLQGKYYGHSGTVQAIRGGTGPTKIIIIFTWSGPRGVAGYTEAHALRVACMLLVPIGSLTPCGVTPSLIA
jgi:hypothetical protein